MGEICTGDNSCHAKINERLQELKASDPELAAVLGDRELSVTESVYLSLGNTIF